MAKRRVYVRDRRGRFAKTGRAVPVGGKVSSSRGSVKAKDVARASKRKSYGTPYKQPSSSPRGTSRVKGKSKSARTKTIRSMKSNEIHDLLNTGSQTSNAYKKRFQKVYPKLTPKQRSNYSKWQMKRSVKALRRVWPGA